MRNNDKTGRGFDVLNKHILGLVFGYLPTLYLHRSAQVNKHWEKAVILFDKTHENIFRKQFPEIHAIIQSHQHKVDWREEFLGVAKFANYFPKELKRIKLNKILIRDWRGRFNKEISGSLFFRRNYSCKDFNLTIAGNDVEKLKKNHRRSKN